ncbi:MAG: type II toxin-antitoxin system RelE/ParE family toxin [Bacteroidales bacterium]|nr:type II toxin-antitoxin system RelE/ParE family toxin [Bacteroidales bacterium]
MEIEFTNKFNKQLDRLGDAKTKNKIKHFIFHATQVDSLKELPNIKKLSGYNYYYRAKIGDYRIAMVLRNNKLTFAAIGKRGDIYKNFP